LKTLKENSFKKNLKGITKRIRKQRARQVPKGSCHKKTFPAAWKKKRKVGGKDEGVWPQPGVKMWMGRKDGIMRKILHVFRPRTSSCPSPGFSGCLGMRVIGWLPIADGDL